MKYVKYTVGVLLISIGVLFALFSFYRTGYKRFYAFEHERLNELINGSEYHDVLFLGSSRAYFHVNPKAVDSLAGLKSFNGGIEGGNILESNLILKCYLARHKAPKLVVIDVAAPSLNINTAPGFRPIFNPNRYYPFLDNPYVFNALKPYKNVHMLKYLPFTQITEADDVLKQASVMGAIGKKSVRADVETYEGYRERSNDTISFPFKKAYDVTNFKIEDEAVALLKETIELCKSKGIKVVLTYAPVYKLQDEILNPSFFPTLQQIGTAYNVPLWNYRASKIGSYHKLFQDEMHLNNRGALIYSLMLGQDIYNYMQGMAKQGTYDSSLLSLFEVYDNPNKEVLTSL
jgi:hypothetical protein